MNKVHLAARTKGMDAVEIVERIQSAHWDMAACQCWICVAGRATGCRPREGYAMQMRRFLVPAMDDPVYRNTEVE